LRTEFDLKLSKNQKSSNECWNKATMYRRRMLLDSKNKKQKSDYESLPNKIKSSITISKKIKK